MSAPTLDPDDPTRLTAVQFTPWRIGGHAFDCPMSEQIDADCAACVRIAAAREWEAMRREAQLRDEQVGKRVAQLQAITAELRALADQVATRYAPAADREFRSGGHVPPPEPAAAADLEHVGWCVTYPDSIERHFHWAPIDDIRWLGHHLRRGARVFPVFAKTDRP